MKGPFVAFLLLTLAGLVMIGREGRRFLRDDMRHTSNPREARLSSLSACAIGVVLLALGAAVVGLLAGVSPYLPSDENAPPSLIITLDREASGHRVGLRGLPPSPTIEPLVSGGWYAIAARRVAWRGPLKWIGFRDAVRPSAVLTAHARTDIIHADKISRSPLMREGVFERVLDGPAGVLGLWQTEEVRTPWRPLTEGSTEGLFTERGIAAVW